MDTLFTFSSTHFAIQAEQTLLADGLPVQVMPLPGQVRAGCGIGLRIPAALRQRAAELMARHGVGLDGIYLRAQAYRPYPLPLFTQALGIRSGEIVSILGCGGKTALLHRLAMENRDRTVLLSTTTKIHRPPQEVLDHLPATPEDLCRGVNLIFGREEQGKLVGLSPDELQGWLDKSELTLLEADGSKGLPLKGWAEHEPVVPPATTITVGVCTVWPVGCPCDGEHVHRIEAFCRLTGATAGDSITLEHLAAMIGGAGGIFSGARGRKLLLVNQVETPGDAELARGLFSRLRRYDPREEITGFWGSVQGGTVEKIGGMGP